MQLDEIKAAVDRGETVHWANQGYTVVKDGIGQYLIAYGQGTRQANYVGLTQQDGVTLNGAPEQFFIASAPAVRA